MSSAILKSLKWYILSVSAIIGTSALLVARNADSIRPVLLAVFAYGLIYIMGSIWKEFREKILMASLVVFVGLSFLSARVPFLLYILFNIDPFQFDPYVLWALTVGVLGIPLMVLAFLRWD